jgi:hypothetical protein
MKQKNIKNRNGFAIAARSRNSAGVMVDENQKRINGKNKMLEFLKELEDDYGDDDKFDCWD